MHPAGGRRARLIGLLAIWALAHASFAWSQNAMPPLPPPRPDRPAPPPSEAPEQKPAAPEGQPEEKSPALESAEAACRERLTQLGLRFESRPPVQENSCRVDNAVLVTGLPGGIEVSPGSLMRCSFAEGLARWVGEVVVREADRHFKSAPKKLLIGTSYQCRDQRSGSKLSEHAFGNGVDVMGFEFDKRGPLTIDSHAEGSPEAQFQDTIRKDACPIFTTVLGPGSDAAHGDHLHLDMRERKGDYRICQ